jgi:hypothetical protein
MIVFSNPGILDVRALTIIGLSAKTTDNPIGKFGSGLKHALAQLLRTGHEVVIYAGLNRYRFTTAEGQMRDKKYNLIMMLHDIYLLDGKYSPETPAAISLGITTDFGPDWKTWMSYRELWANCMDEGGSVWQGDADNVGQDVTSTLEGSNDDIPDWTIITISGPEIDKAHEESFTFILSPKAEPIFENENIEIYKAPSSAIFFRNMKVMETKNPCLYTYNILRGVDLSEDRQANNYIQVNNIIGRGIQALDREDLIPIIRAVLSKSSKDFHEKDINWEWTTWSQTPPSRTFLATVADMRRKDTLRADPAKLAVRGGSWYSPEFTYVECPPTELEQGMISHDITFVALLGFPEVYDIKIKLSEDVDVDDQHQIQDDELFIHPSMLERGRHQLIMLLVDYLLRRKLMKEQANYNGTISWLLGQWLRAKGLKFVDDKPIEPDNSNGETVLSASATLAPRASPLEGG